MRNLPPIFSEMTSQAMSHCRLRVRVMVLRRGLRVFIIPHSRVPFPSSFVSYFTSSQFQVPFHLPGVAKLLPGLWTIYYLHLFVSCILGTHFSRKVCTETTRAHARRHGNTRHRLRPTLRRRHLVRHFTARARGSIAECTVTSRPPF